MLLNAKIEDGVLTLKADPLSADGYPFTPLLYSPFHSVQSQSLPSSSKNLIRLILMLNGWDVTVARIHHSGNWVLSLEAQRNKRGGNKKGQIMIAGGKEARRTAVKIIV